MMLFSVYLVIGALAGVLAGLFGIGGGVVIIPALAGIFVHHTLIPSQDVMQMAIGTSLATVIVTATSAMYAHHKRAAVVWGQVWKMIPGLAIGAILGAIVAHFLPSTELRIIFSIFLVITSVRMFLKESEKKIKRVLSANTVRIGSGLIGFLSSILGVGGGTLLVPFLLMCELDMHQAMGTSVACGLVVSIIATLCFMVTGWLGGVHLPWSTGYIYWPAFLGISVASFLFAPMGATLAHKLPTSTLKRLFAIFLLIMAIDMMFF